MIDIHLIDAQGMYVESRTVSELAPIPANAVFVDPPVITGGAVARWSGDGWDVLAERPPISSVEESVAMVVKTVTQQIDMEVDAIYAFAVGNRTTEYQKAEAQARAYRAAGYGGETPNAVASWAKATGKSTQWAADDIIATADAWHTAEDTIRDVRLACKEAARNSKTEIELAAVRSQWSAFVTRMRAQLGE